MQPTEILPGSDKKIWWVGQTCGHTWQARVANRTVLNRGCPVCNNLLVVAGVNDFASRYPHLLQEWSNRNTVKSDEVAYASDKKVYWVCVRNHEWEASLRRRGEDNTGCPYCSVPAKKAWRGETDLLTLYPNVAAELDSAHHANIDPGSILPGSEAKYWFNCDNGHQYQLRLTLRTKFGMGCSVCSPAGTSKIEKDLHAALHDKLEDINPVPGKAQIRTRSGKLVTVDILGMYNNKKVVIEYDGAYWHRDKAEKDAVKTSLLLNSGYLVVRVRENSGQLFLQDLTLTDAKLRQVSYTYGHSVEELSASVMKMLQTI